MGQIVKRKKKGRPAKADPGARDLPQAERDLRRSLRRRNVKYVFDLDDYFDEDEVFADDEDQRRREKKLKLLLKLQSGGGGGDSESTVPRDRRYEHAPATSASSSEDGRKPSKKRKIDEEMDDYVDEENDYANEEDNYNYEDDEEVRDTKPENKAEEDSLPGTPACGLPMPEKKTLELILDKLQRKDIYGVYAEPVDPDELPDYHDVIEHPMDFATVRNKLKNELYTTFEQFESDVFLICSNAMRYNAPDTIYHKQARTIQELAKRKFHKVRLKADSIEKDIKAEQKTGSGSIPKKQIKRSVSRSMQEPVGSDFSSGATLATAGDIQNVPSTLQAVGSEKTSGVDVLVEGSSFLNDNNLDKVEESFPGKGPLSRFGRRSFVQDENRRATYNISLSLPVASSETIFSTFDGEMKQLVPVGLYSDHSYARSMARFAASLGSVAWKVASNRIEQALPQGFKFGQGWVGEYEPLPTPILMLENCRVTEPPFLTKTQPIALPKKLEKIPTISDSSKETPRIEPFLAQKLPFLGPTRIRPASIITTQPIRENISGVKPSEPHNLSYHHQNLQSRESEKKVVELNSPGMLNYNNAADSVVSKQFSKSSEMEASRPMDFSAKNMNSPRMLNYNNAADSVVNKQFSKSSEMEASRPMDFSAKNMNSPCMLNYNNAADSVVNKQFPKSSEMEASRSMDFSAKNMNSPRMLNYNNAADSVVNKQFPKSSEMEAPRPMDFSAKNVNSPRMLNYNNAADSVVNKQFPKSSETEASRPMDFSAKNMNSPRMLNYNNAADSVVNRQFPKSSETEASRPMDFSAKNMNFSRSGSFKQPDNTNGVAYGGVPPNGKVIANRMAGGNMIARPSLSCDLTKPANYYPHDQQGQGLSDPVQMMRKIAENTHNQQKPSNNAATAAARAWMSVGAGGLRPVAENANANSNANASLYHMRPQVSQFPGEYPHTFVPQGAMQMIVGNHQVQFQNQRMVFPQFQNATADLSRFQLQSNWGPQMHSRQKQESLPPDLNIGGFQSSGSPTSGVLVDSQQPDLALQL